MKYDLHTHTTASDGLLSPTELVLRAVEQGVEMLAITDHDTVAGIAEAKKAAENQPIRLISGVEISIVWLDNIIHWLDVCKHQTNDNKLYVGQQNLIYMLQQVQISITQQVGSN